MTDTAIMHALYPLAEFPVLAALASPHTTATKLDGRACLHLYRSALGDIDWLTLSSSEREFMRLLGYSASVRVVASRAWCATPATM